MYVVSADLNAIPKKQKECQQTLQLIVERCLMIRGCRNAQYKITPGDENTFQLIIEWNDPKNWKNFKQTNAFKALMGMKHLLSRDLHIISTDKQDKM